jgi:cytochrome b subunit of formate dehydrogenase
MHKLKQAAYGVASGAMLLAPALASAQWLDRGQENAEQSQLPTGSIYDIIRQTMNWILAILGFIAIIGFVIAGILYLTAAGDESQVEKAKTAMTYSIIGIIVALMGFVIVQAVNTWLGGTNSAF